MRARAIVAKCSNTSPDDPQPSGDCCFEIDVYPEVMQGGTCQDYRFEKTQRTLGKTRMIDLLKFGILEIWSMNEYMWKLKLMRKDEQSHKPDDCTTVKHISTAFEEVDEAELKKLLVIKKDEDIAIDTIPLATKLPVIIDYKVHKEGMLVHYQLIRAYGSSKRYSSMIRMLQGIDREELEALWRIVKAKYGDTRPDNEFERVLWGDLKVTFELDKQSDVWRILQGYRVTIWKLIDSSGVHFVRFDNLHIFMLVEKRYPSHQLPSLICSTRNFKLIIKMRRNLKIQKMNIKFRGGLLGLKRLHGFLEVTAAQVHNGNYAKCWMWKVILGLRDKAKEHIEFRVGNGISISVWYDKWNDIGPLCQIITRRDIYDVSKIKLFGGVGVESLRTFLLSKLGMIIELTIMMFAGKIWCGSLNPLYDSHDHHFFQCKYAADVLDAVKDKGYLNGFKQKWIDTVNHIVVGHCRAIKSVVSKIVFGAVGSGKLCWVSKRSNSDECTIRMDLIEGVRSLSSDALPSLPLDLSSEDVSTRWI
ncbi:hypothetical protein Tco_1499404 [Tanacetum coccineum]